MLPYCAAGGIPRDGPENERSEHRGALQSGLRNRVVLERAANISLHTCVTALNLRLDRFKPCAC